MEQEQKFMAIKSTRKRWWKEIKIIWVNVYAGYHTHHRREILLWMNTEIIIYYNIQSEFYYSLFYENREKKQLSFYTILTILPMCDHWIITNVPIFLDILLRESLICLTSLDQLFWFDVLCFWLVLWLIWRVFFLNYQSVFEIE